MPTFSNITKFKSVVLGDVPQAVGAIGTTPCLGAHVILTRGSGWLPRIAVIRIREQKSGLVELHA